MILRVIFTAGTFILTAMATGALLGFVAPISFSEPIPTNLVATDSVAPLSSPPSMVDFTAFANLVTEVQAYRDNGHLITFDTFLKMANEPNTIILDARSHPMYEMKHLKGAVHLNFADFTQQTLAAVIPSRDTRILIYCNNNFSDDQLFFESKVVLPSSIQEKPVSLALNIPTFINLYGYGYKNVYELSSLLSVYDPKVVFEGKAMKVFNRLQPIRPKKKAIVQDKVGGR